MMYRITGAFNSTAQSQNFFWSVPCVDSFMKTGFVNIHLFFQ